MKQLVILSSLILFLTQSLYAADAKKVIDSGLTQPWVGARALGMGNAFTAVADDHNAIFYNPAGLARKEKGDLRLFLAPTLDLEILDFIDDVDAALDVPDGDKPASLTTLLKKNAGEFFHARLVGPSAIWTRKGWGVAVIPVNLLMNTQIVSAGAGFAVGLDANLDSTVALSYAQDEDWFGKDHWVSWGVTSKIINRIGINKKLIAADALTDEDEFFDVEKESREGMTFDIDIGALWTPKISPGSWLSYAEPTFSVSVKNLLDYGFPVKLGLVSENDDDDPVKLGRRLDFGSAWQLPGFWVFDTKAAFDIRDVGHDNWTFKKSYHAGVEFHWKMKEWWQGHWSVGVNQGYFAAGFGGKLGWAQLDIAFWGEEVGTKSVRQEDRRYLAELSLNF